MRYYLAACNPKILYEYTNKIQELIGPKYWKMKNYIKNNVVYTDDAKVVPAMWVKDRQVLRAMYDAAKHFSPNELRFTQVSFIGFED